MAAERAGYDGGMACLGGAVPRGSVRGIVWAGDADAVMEETPPGILARRAQNEDEVDRLLSPGARLLDERSWNRRGRPRSDPATQTWDHAA